MINKEITEMKYNKLAMNTFLFFIANFGSKFISFFMVPLYTFALTTSEYGTVDIIQSTVMLLTPFVSFGIGDIVVLYLVQKREPIEKTVSNAIVMLALGNSVILLFILLLDKIGLFTNYVLFLIILVFLQSFYTILQSIARGLDKVKLFALSGILYTVVLVTMNYLLLVKFNSKITGYLISLVLSNLVCCLYLISKLKLNQFLHFSCIDFEMIKKVLKLSIPLLPTAILWTLMNVADKYTIVFFNGTSGNGIYTVAHKIPTIIATLYSIFQSAWQIATFEFSSKSERSQSYSSLFELLTCALFIIGSILILVCEPFVVVFCEKSYYSAWNVMNILVLSSVYNALSGFLGSNYIPMNNTVGALKITFMGTLINVILNIILVATIGVKGAAISTCISFLYMVIKKMYDTRDFTPLNIKYNRFVMSNILLLVQIILFQFSNSFVIYSINTLISILLIFTYIDVIKLLVKNVIHKVKRRWIK